MKSIKEFLSKHKKKIVCIFIFLLVMISVTNVFAKINKNSSELKKDIEFFKSIFGDNAFGNFLDSSLENITDFVATTASNFINAIGQVAAGAIMKLLNVFVLAAAAVMFLLFYTFWSIFGGSIFDLPWPDKIVFNEMAMFDPNFINYDAQSTLYGYAKSTQFIHYLAGAVKTLYFSFFVIAGAIMIVAALVIGIKLAISSISVEKAQYKEILNKWIVGMVILFSLHFIIAGCFTINEKICEIASEVSNVVEIRYNITDLNLITKAASVIKSIFNGLGSLLTGGGLSGFADGDIIITFKGYQGVMFYLLFNAVFNLDLISSITLLAVLGQTINLIFKYIKRLFYIVFLAMLGPLIVAVDVVKRIV